jgi:hypothetical protein
MKTSYAFSRRGPDRVTEALAGVLSASVSYEFKALFTIVFADLKAKNAASGGEEMLRLRAYEKLQNMVQTGVVKKSGKEYRGVPAALITLLETSANQNQNPNPTGAATVVAAAAVVTEPVAVSVGVSAPKKRRSVPSR